MLLYHGSNAVIKQVDLTLSRAYKDFGRGFYCTNVKCQAEATARRISRLYGGQPFVSVYELDEAVFSTPSTDWAQFVINNRKNKSMVDAGVHSNHDNRFDLVVGPGADDEMYAQFQLLQDGIIDLQVLATKLQYMKHSNQYSFHSTQALTYLTFVEGY